MADDSTLRSVSLSDKFEATDGHVFISGTQALIRAVLLQRELDAAAGLNTGGYVSGYRGSPMGGLDSTAYREKARLEAAGVVFRPAVNEELAATALWGTQQLDAVPNPNVDGVFGLWYGKGPGVDRAGDALRHGNTAGAHPNGGVVVAYGDDHPGKSSTVAHQSEQTLAALSIPSLYPASVHEFIEYSLLGWALSRYCGLWVGLKCVNETVEQTGTVDLAAAMPDVVLPDIAAERIPPEGLHILPTVYNPQGQEVTVSRFRLPLVHDFVRANRIDKRVFGAAQPRIGIVTAGKACEDTMQALHLLGLDAARCEALGIGVYKVGCIWPLEGENLRAFAERAEAVVFVEEKKGFIEQQAHQALYALANRPSLYGKHGPDGLALLPSDVQIHGADVATAIAAVLRAHGGLDAALGQAVDGLTPPPQALPMPPRSVLRTPFFCSGCPHNTSTKVPDGSMAMSGIGCHAMAAMRGTGETLPPTQMGGEGANWIGLEAFTDTPHMFQNLGDGTYYHSGLLAVRQAVAAGSNVTYKILFNDAVAMTGGQPHDGPISVGAITHQVMAEGAAHCVVVSDDPDTYTRESGLAPGVAVKHRNDLDAVQRELRDARGVSVIVYQQTCATEKRRGRKRGTYPDPPMRQFIFDAVCEGCGDCSVQSNCVSIQPIDTAFGVKRRIDQSTCNKDASCVRGFCPSFVTVEGADVRKPELPSLDGLFADLPEPVVRSVSVGTSYAVMIAGIGGTGVVTVGAVLGMAAHLEGKAASTYDMTGLSQKNGAVFSHLRIAGTNDDIRVQRVGRGEADLVLAFDLLATLLPEASTTITAGQSALVGNSSVAPTAFFQIEPADANRPPERLIRDKVAELVGDDHTHLINGTQLARELCGDTVAVNLMMLGFAAQKGLLPVSMAALMRAVEINGVAVAFNQRAFSLGRVVAHDPAQLEPLLVPADARSSIPRSFDEIVAHRAAHLTGYQDATWADRYAQTVSRVQAAEAALGTGSTALAETAARSLAKLMSYKDEYEVGRLYSSPAFEAALREQFEDGGSLSFHLAPPILCRPDARTGVAKKRRFGPWVLKAFGLLARGKRLRGTALDVFGYTAERRMERELITDFETRLNRVCASLSRDNLATAIEIAGVPDEIRGYGHVKERNVVAARARWDALDVEFASAPAVAAAASESA
ncbi:MAG: indolepyruvate ferredoxin oxidoreductase family protein [Pseudomonadota bacterium]